MHFEKLKKVQDNSRHRINFFLGMLMVVFLCSCYEQREGCLDPNAVNFDPSSDLNVDCRYPALTLNFDANGPGVAFSYDSVFYDSQGAPYQLLFAAFFIQPFEIQVEGEWTPLSGKQFDVTLQDGQQFVFQEDVSLLEPRIFTNSIDSVISFEAFTSVRTAVGLGSIGELDSAAIPPGSSLGQRVNMIGEDGIFDYLVIIDRDTSAATDISSFSGRLVVPESIQFSLQGVIEPAKDANWILEVYYDEWLSVLNIAEGNEENQQRLESNFGNVLSLVIPQ